MVQMRAESIMSMMKVVKDTSLRATLPIPIDSSRGLTFPKEKERERELIFTFLL
jgi:hypothetical protein